MAAEPEVIAVIPARFASVRLPGKPLLDIAGKPMIRHVCERAALSRLVTRVVVATDHPSIEEVVRKFGVEAVMTPPGLPSGTDRVAHAARSLQGDPILVNVQGDEPLISPETIDAAVRTLVGDRSVSVGTVASSALGPGEMQNPDIVKVVMDLNGNALYFSRAPVPYIRGEGSAAAVYRHIGLYAYRKSFLEEFTAWAPTPLEEAERLEQLRILEHGRSIRVTVTASAAVAVDTPADLELVRALMAKQTESQSG
jgi:3-deoxy-manno-octulosonate cytidylyltransferase (CMP-KDO synthetase)